MFGGEDGLGSPKKVWKRLGMHFGRFFQKVRQLIGRKKIYKPTSEEFGDESDFVLSS
jgi:hypothetical protein